MALSADIATLIGFACETFLYGTYVVLFILSLIFLVWRRRSRDLDTLLVSATCVLFTLCTIHFLIQLDHFYSHLTVFGVKLFSAETIPLAVGDFILTLADFAGDLVLIYRCWLVWGKNYYVIILPSLTAFSGFVCGIITFHLVITIGLNHQQPPPALVQLGTGLLALPLCTNVMVTFLIVARIFHMAYKTRSQFPKEIHTSSTNTSRSTALVWHAAAIVVESGMLYLVGQLVLVILFATKNPAYKVVGYPIIQIYGIAPTLIFCRVGMGISAERTYSTAGDLPSFRAPGSNYPLHSHGVRSHSTSGGSTVGQTIGKMSVVGRDEDFEMTFAMKQS